MYVLWPVCLHVIVSRFLSVFISLLFLMPSSSSYTRIKNIIHLSTTSFVQLSETYNASQGSGWWKPGWGQDQENNPFHQTAYREIHVESSSWWLLSAALTQTLTLITHLIETGWRLNQSVNQLFNQITNQENNEVHVNNQLISKTVSQLFNQLVKLSMEHAWR